MCPIGHPPEKESQRRVKSHTLQSTQNDQTTPTPTAATQNHGHHKSKTRKKTGGHQSTVESYTATPTPTPSQSPHFPSMIISKASNFTTHRPLSPLPKWALKGPHSHVCMVFSSADGSPRWSQCHHFTGSQNGAVQKKPRSAEEEERECGGGGERRVSCEVDMISWRERRVKAEISVNADVDSVWNALTDYERLADFIPNLVSRYH